MVLPDSALKTCQKIEIPLVSVKRDSPNRRHKKNDLEKLYSTSGTDERGFIAIIAIELWRILPENWSVISKLSKATQLFY